MQYQDQDNTIQFVILRKLHVVEINSLKVNGYQKIMVQKCQDLVMLM